jgi:hypothetical protein
MAWTDNAALLHATSENVEQEVFPAGAHDGGSLFRTSPQTLSSNLRSGLLPFGGCHVECE